MAKDYKKGSDYRLYLNTGSYGAPTWAEIKACGDVAVANQPVDVEVPERGMDTGHLQGEKDPQFTFTLFEDAGDSNVETLVAAIYAGTMKELAVSRGPLATTGNKYFRMESVLFADVSANRADPSQYAVTAKRHANSDYAMTRNTAA